MTAEAMKDDLSPRQRRLLELMLAEKRQRQAPPAPATIPRRGGDEPPLLSFAQQRLWFIEQFQPGTAAYNIPSGVRLAGPLDAGLFAESLRRTAERHETLRTTFVLDGGQPVQHVAPRSDARLPLVDLSALPARRRERLAQRVVDRLARLPLDLAASPPWRAVLVRLAAEEHVFLAVMHHIISDTWTTGVFFREMVGHYRALADGGPAKLPALAVQYADYAMWQRRELADGDLRRQLDYWKEKFAGAPPLLELPLDRPRPPVPSFRGGRITLRLPRSLTDRLRELATAAEGTLFMAFMAAYQMLLHRFSGQDDVLVGTPMANRTRVELENLIGLFVNTLVLRTDFAGSPSFRQLLARVRETTLEGLSHHDVPFEKVVEELELPRDTRRNPLFQVLFAFQNVPIPQLVAEGLTLERYEFRETTARLDVELDLQEMPYGFVGWLGYNSDLFERATAERLAAAFNRLLEAAVAAPDLPLADLPLLSPEERLQVTRGWNDTARPYDQERSIHQLFEAQAAREPQAVAVEALGARMTYRELDEAANRLARLLVRRGVGGGSPVAVHLDRSAKMVVALLGILKAGGAYVPLDPAYPAARMAAVGEEARIRIAVAEASRLETVAALAPLLADVVSLDGTDGADAAGLAAGVRLWGPADLAEEPPTPPPVDHHPDRLAYVIFTSGSTGKPKGVMVRHRPVINLVEWVNGTFGVGPGDKLLFVTSLSFDLSVYDVFGILAAGGTIRVASEAELREPTLLVAVLAGEGITFWDSAPAALQQLVPSFPREPAAASALRLVFLSGDWIPVTLPDRVRQAFPGARVVSLGGATEATVWSNWYPVEEVEAWWPSIPYGRPIQNARYHVLDERLEPLPVGVAGDLYIGGECLSDGYLARPALTAERYVPDPWGEGGRLYRTGDRSRFWNDGNLEFLGRLDSQVKVRGYRIELGEIETVLAQHPAVEAVAAHAWGEAAGDRRLVAYVVPRAGAEPAAAELRAWVGERLPEYMVPWVFTFLAELPVTANGKLDRRALPAPEAARGEDTRYVDPEGELEAAIAGVWKRVLGVERVGKNDNFFELGGHSLLLAQVHQELGRETAPELTLVDLFTYPTVASLADFLSRRQGAAPAGERSLERAARRRDAAVGAVEKDVAIIGVALRYPRAATPEQYWDNLRQGRECISFFSLEEVIAAGVDPQLAAHPDYVRAEGTVDAVDGFDHRFFGYADPKEVELIDPQQRIFMECAWEALERAGYDPGTYPGSIGIVGGVNISSYLFNTLYDYDPYNVMSSFLTRIGLLVGNQNDYLCTRVAYHFNLTGPALTVQSACSTATVALHLAAQSLLRHECDMALAGGVQIRVPQNMGYLYQEGGFPSPDGHCRSFDAAAKGNVHGNGAGVMLLKRLSDAVADGDHIHAVIKGSAMANDGSVKVGFTAPGVDGQMRAAAEAMAVADVHPDSIGYLEATGTATELGDPIEIEALTRAWRMRTDRKVFCPIGSVKSNIGHTDAASGAAAVIKAALALEHEEIPPSLHFERPNPRIDFANSPFFVNTERRSWPRGEEPRRAAVHTYAVGGTNTHVILEEPPRREASSPSRPWHLLPLSARSSTALHAATANLAEHLRRHPEQALADVAWTLQVGRRRHAARRLVLCRDVEEAVSALETLPEDRVWTVLDDGDAEAAVAFFAPAALEAPAAALADLLDEEPAFRAAVEDCASHLPGELRRPAAELVAAGADGGDPRLGEPARAVVAIALARLWSGWGVEPRTLAGEGVGEIVAAHLAGALPIDAALALAAARGRVLAAAPAEAALEVHLPADELAAELAAASGDGLALDAVLAPALCRVRGPEAALEALQDRLNAGGVDCLWRGARPGRPRVDAGAAFAEALAGVEAVAPRRPFLAADGSRPGGAELVDADWWAARWAAPARLDLVLGGLAADDDRVVVALGAAGEAADAAAAAGVAAERWLDALPAADGPGQHLAAALGRLWLAGAAVDWPGYHAGESRRRVPLPTYPFERVRIWAKPSMDRGQALARLDRSGGGRRPIDEWFSAPSWRRDEALAAAPEVAEAEAADGIWLLIADRDELASALAEELAAAGRHLVWAEPADAWEVRGPGAYRLRLGHEEDFHALLAELGGAPRRVILLAALGADAADPRAAAERCLWPPLHLARAVARAGVADPVEITVVTAGVEEVTGDEELAPARAIAQAPVRVLPRELPSLGLSSIDVVLPRTAARREELAARLAAEVLRPPVAARLALRGRHRWLAVDERVALPAPAGRPATLRQGGVYLLLGGLAGLGLRVARELVERAGARLAILGPPSDPAAVAEVEGLGGETLFLDLDPADEAAVAAAAARVAERFGAVHGLVQTGGELGPELVRGVAEADPAFVAARLAARRGGVETVERALAAAELAEPLDFVLLVSTLGGVLGGPGIVADCAADLYLDALARERDRRGGTRWTSVAWDALRRAAAGAGEGISIDEAAEVFTRLLDGPPRPQVVVSAGDLAVRRAAAAGAAEADGGAHRASRPELATPYAAPETDAERQIAAIWEDVLALDGVGRDDNFFDLGGNSLVATQLVSRLRGAFLVDLPLQDFFDGATVADVARSLEVARWMAESAGGQAVAVGGDDEVGEI